MDIKVSAHKRNFPPPLCSPSSMGTSVHSIRHLPLTPPSLFDDTNNEADEQSLQTALHVMSTEADSLFNLHKLYSSNSLAQEGFRNSVQVICKNRRRGGCLVVCGVGKSAKVGKKAVATMNSFGIRSLFLHPTEALHGDLGMIGEVRH